MKNKDIHLLAFYVRVPKDPKKTHMKDFGKDESNFAYNEEVHVTLGLKDKDLLRANVIINVNQKKVIKCSLNPDADFLDLYSYYKKNYPQYLNVLEKGLYGEESTTVEQDNTD